MRKKCPRCGSLETVKHGFVAEDIPRYKCKECKKHERKYVFDDRVDYRFKSNAEKQVAIMLFNLIKLIEYADSGGKINSDFKYGNILSLSKENEKEFSSLLLELDMGELADVRSSPAKVGIYISEGKIVIAKTPKNKGASCSLPGKRITTVVRGEF